MEVGVHGGVGCRCMIGERRVARRSLGAASCGERASSFALCRQWVALRGADGNLPAAIFGAWMKGLGVEVERAKGIEPSSVAWEATALPLSYARAGQLKAFISLDQDIAN